MRRGAVLAGVAILLSLFLLPNPAGAIEKGPDGKIILRMAHSSPVGNPTDIASKKWIELIGQRTGGKIEVKLFPNEQLGSEKACLEGVVLGTIDISLKAGLNRAVWSFAGERGGKPVTPGEYLVTLEVGAAKLTQLARVVN